MGHIDYAHRENV